MKVNNDKQHNLLKQIANLKNLYLVPYCYLILWVLYSKIFDGGGILWNFIFTT